MNKRSAGVLVASVAAVLSLGACSVKQVDPAITGAQLVPGTGNLYRFCDGPTLIYYSNWGGASNDEYEFIVYEGCVDGAEVDPNDVQNLPDEDN